MTSYRGWGAVAFGAAMLWSGTTSAHFVLQTPPAMTVQNALGDPQKAPPCGGGLDLTGETTAFTAGETITISIDETVYHPGHYRVALAINDPSELPDAPPVTPGATDCGTTTIQDPPVFPVIADGMIEHDMMFGKPQAFDVTLPDMNCDNCTLQVIQFMSDHGAPCYYYKCANISIEGASGATSSDSAGSTGDGDTATTGDGGDASTSAEDESETSPSATNPDTNDDSDSDASASESASATATATATAGATDSSAVPENMDDEGCGCSTDRKPGHLVALLGLLALFSLRRRR